mmetsp:Transcript_23049/g.50194  ORF Transcript_23049/g.50194 Transcript_23049/m.50194 type:complete len:116 (-) Transcript_23049:81-428(-)
MTHIYLAMPILVFGMYKFGFPETILYLYVGLYDKFISCFQRAMDLINGIGTLIHHSTSAHGPVLSLSSWRFPVLRQTLHRTGWDRKKKSWGNALTRTSIAQMPSAVSNVDPNLKL